MLGPMLRAAAGNGGVSVLDPAHPDLALMVTMDGILGSALVDQSGNLSDGTIYGATVVAGLNGDALSYDGNDYVAFQADSQSQLAFIHQTGVFHIASWISVTNPNSNTNQSVMGSSVSTVDKGFWFGVEDRSANGWDKTLRMAIHKGVSGNAVVDFVGANSVYPEDGGYHLVEVWGDGSTCYLSVDLATIGSSTFSAFGAGDSTRALNLGRVNHSTPFSYMTGKEDFSAIYTRPLTTAERTQIFNGV